MTAWRSSDNGLPLTMIKLHRKMIVVNIGKDKGKIMLMNTPARELEMGYDS
jgi:hypothetical protein